jgi:hypothetical protein
MTFRVQFLLVVSVSGQASVSSVGSSQTRVTNILEKVPKILAGVDAFKKTVDDATSSQEVLLNGKFGTLITLDELANEMQTAFGQNSCPDESGTLDIANDCLCGGEIFCVNHVTGVNTQCYKAPDKDPTCVIQCSTGGHQTTDKIMDICTCGSAGNAPLCGGFDSSLLDAKTAENHQNQAGHDPSWCWEPTGDTDAVPQCLTFPTCPSGGLISQACKCTLCTAQECAADCVAGQICDVDGTTSLRVCTTPAN